MDIVNLLLVMSYNMPKMLSSEYQSHSIKIEDLKINPINSFIPISTKGRVNFLNLLLRMFYIMPKMVGSEFQSPSIKIEDVCLSKREKRKERGGQGAPIELGPLGQLVMYMGYIVSCSLYFLGKRNKHYCCFVSISIFLLRLFY